ncbi:hypothetical protein PBS_15290 [Paraburkholderia sp. 2C]
MQRRASAIQHRFFSAFSPVPTLLIVLAVLGWFIGDEVAQGRFFAQVKAIMGPEAASAMRAIAEHAHRMEGGASQQRYRSYCCWSARVSCHWSF